LQHKNAVIKQAPKTDNEKLPPTAKGFRDVNSSNNQKIHPKDNLAVPMIKMTITPQYQETRTANPH